MKPTFRDDEQLTLEARAYSGDEEGVKALLKAGSRIQGTDCVSCISPLHYAVAGGHLNVAKILIDHGADVNWNIVVGYSPLHLAAKIGNLEMVNLLLASGSDPGIEDEDGNTPLIIAALAGHANVVRIIRKSLHPEIPVHGRKPRTPDIHRAAELGDLEDLENHLMSGSDINSVNADGLTPLFHAVIGGHSHTVKFLLKNGALPNPVDKTGDTPMDYAMLLDREDIVSSLKQFSGRAARPENKDR